MADHAAPLISVAAACTKARAGAQLEAGVNCAGFHARSGLRRTAQPPPHFWVIACQQ